MDTNKITDPLNRGMVAGLLGTPADMVNMLRNAGRSVQNLTLMAQNKPTIPMQQDPAYGQEWWGNKMQQMGYVTTNRNPVAEFGAGLLDPTGIADALAVKAPMLAQGLFNLGDPALMTVTKGLLAKKAYDVAPDVARAAAKNISAPATLNTPMFMGQRGAMSLTPKKLITVDHPTLGKSVPVKVVATKDVKGMKFDIDGGQAVLKINPVFATDKQYVRTQMNNGYAVDDFLWGLGDDVFVRTSDNLDDFKHIQNRTHRGSINHVTGQPEGGLSVSRNPAHAAGKHAYLVRGKVIGQGSDAEPLLDLGSVVAASEAMPLSKAFDLIDSAARKKAEKLGLTKEDLRAIRTATDLDFTRMFD